MKYTTLGNTGLIVSRLAFGAMTFGTGDMFGFKLTVNQKEADEMVAKALDAGVNFFDTADMYGMGRSEEMLGKALGEKRKDIIITTKVGARQSNAIINAGLSYQHIISACKASLKRLGTDYIDLYLLHFDDRITNLEEMLRALEYLVQKGYVRYIGFSNFSAWKAATALGIQKHNGWAQFAATQINYSLIERDAEHEILPFVQHAGLGTMIWSPLSGGFLTGKYTRKDPTGGGGRLAKFSFPPIDKEKGYAVVDKVREIAKRHNATVTQVSLAWLLTKPNVTSAIMGMSKTEQLEDNIKAVDIKLTIEEQKTLDDLTKPKPIYPNWMYEQPFDPITHEALTGEKIEWPQPANQNKQ